MEQTVEGDTPLIAVVIVHWINIDDTIECIESLTEINYPRFHLFLVNNGSPDFDYERVKKVFPETHVILSKDNLGFAGGYNLGIEKGINTTADYFFLLNNDTVVSPDIFNILIPPMIDPNVGVVGPAIENYYEPERIWFSGGKFSRVLGFSYRRRPLITFEQSKSVDWINGCAMLIKRDVIEEIGILWEPFFLYFEDLDFCLRARRANYLCVQVGKSLVKHKISASGGLLGNDQFSPNKAYYFGRNVFLLIPRNCHIFFKITGMVSQFLIVLPYWIIQCILNRNAKVIVDYLSGMRDGLINRFGERPS